MPNKTYQTHVYKKVTTFNVLWLVFNRTLSISRGGIINNLNLNADLMTAFIVIMT